MAEGAILAVRNNTSENNNVHKIERKYTEIEQQDRKYTDLTPEKDSNQAPYMYKNIFKKVIISTKNQ